MSISINQVRKSTSLYWDGSIKEDLLIEIKDRIDRYEVEVIKEVIKEFKRCNDFRRYHHLPLLRKLTRPKIYKQTDDSKIGENGEKPIAIHSSKADEVFL